MTCNLYLSVAAHKFAYADLCLRYTFQVAWRLGKPETLWSTCIALYHGMFYLVLFTKHLISLLYVYDRKRLIATAMGCGWKQSERSRRLEEGVGIEDKGRGKVEHCYRCCR